MEVFFDMKTGEEFPSREKQKAWAEKYIKASDPEGMAIKARVDADHRRFIADYMAKGEG